MSQPDFGSGGAKLHVAHPTIRVQRPGDEPQVHSVLREAFGHSTEADLVDVLRGRDAIIGSWVAEIDGRLVGCAVYSPIRLEPALPDSPVVGLGPVGVRPDFQRHGIGTAMIGYSLRRVKGLGIAAVVVLGKPHYYRRFGFRSAHEFGMDSDFDASADAFMAMELIPGAMDRYRGRAHFHHAFEVLGQ